MKKTINIRNFVICLIFIVTAFASNAFAEDNTNTEVVATQNEILEESTIEKNVESVDDTENIYKQNFMTADEKYKKLVRNRIVVEGMLPLGLETCYYEEELTEEEKKAGRVFTCHTEDYSGIIDVYKFKAGENDIPATLEEMTKYEAEQAGNKKYLIDTVEGYTYGHFSNIEDYNGDIYLAQYEISKVDDDFIMTVYYLLTAEEKLSDDNLYAYVPVKGNLIYDLEQANTFSRKYDATFYIPDTKVSVYSYKNWDNDYTSHADLTEEEWKEALNKKTGKAFTIDDEINAVLKNESRKLIWRETYNYDGYEYDEILYEENGITKSVVYFEFSGNVYKFEFIDERADYPHYTEAFIKGIHTK